MVKYIFCKPHIILTIILSVVTAIMLPTTLHARKNAVRQDAQLLVQAAALGLGGLLRQVESREDQILMIRDYVHPARFFTDDSGYFFVIDTTGVCIAHGIQREYEGQNMLNAIDANGIPIFDSMIEICETGGGFIEYMWNKPGAQGSFKKLGYVEPIPGTDFIIGTGIYFPSPW
jgi:signal transduction histidine kinase